MLDATAAVTAFREESIAATPVRPPSLDPALPKFCPLCLLGGSCRCLPLPGPAQQGVLCQSAETNAHVDEVDAVLSSAKAPHPFTQGIVRCLGTSNRILTSHGIQKAHSKSCWKNVLRTGPDLPRWWKAQATPTHLLSCTKARPPRCSAAVQPPDGRALQGTARWLGSLVLQRSLTTPGPCLLRPQRESA